MLCYDGNQCTSVAFVRINLSNEYGEVGGMRICTGNLSTRRDTSPLLLSPPQTPHYLTWDRIRVAAVGGVHYKAVTGSIKKITQILL